MADPPSAWKRLTIYVTPGEHRALRAESYQRGKTMSEIVREALHSRIMFVAHTPIAVEETKSEENK